MGGPLCTTRVRDQWIDGGTLCRSRSTKPGPVGLDDLIEFGKSNLNPLKAQFDREHVYSMAPEAARKRDIDLQIIGDDYSRSAEIKIDNEKYLKELIRRASDGKQRVSDKAKKIQFFIVRGGAEGLLPASMATKDASNVLIPGSTTDGASFDFRFDENDLLAVFDPKGALIGAALLQRPTSITGIWTTKTANDIYNAWHNKDVSIYRNKNFEIPYLGLVVADGMKKRGWVDMHKQEDTNGCIFIVDPATPAVGTEELKTFEPQLLIDILASIGKSPDDVQGSIWLGVMHLVDIK